jgi:hypothetical protein
MAVESSHKLILNSVGLRVSQHALLALLLFALALAPRVLAVGDFWTCDEPFHWLKRSESFLQAMQYSNYADTNLTGHPGVTTMWLGSAGLLLHQGMAHLGWIDPADSAVQRGRSQPAPGNRSATSPGRTRCRCRTISHRVTTTSRWACMIPPTSVGCRCMHPLRLPHRPLVRMRCCWKR